MIPNLFKKLKIPKEIPEELDKKIKEFAKNKNKELFLKKAFFYVVSKNKGHRGNVILKFIRLYKNKPEQIINCKGYMHCTTMNYLLRIMLVKSNLFEDKDIKLKLTHSWFIAPHQFLRIKIKKGRTINLDPWNYQFGIDYGNFGKGFDSTKFFPIR